MLLDEKELCVWERIGFFLYLLTSLFFDKYQKYLLFLAAINFFLIYCLYIYNFLRHPGETESNKLEESSEGGVEKIYLSGTRRIVFIDHLRRLLREEVSKRKAMESELELEKEKMNVEINKLTDEFKEETVSLIEQLRVSEEEIEVMAKIHEEKCRRLEKEKRDAVEEVKATQEEACSRINELWREREQDVSELNQRCRKLEERNEDLRVELEWERVKKSGLEEMHTRLLEETGSLRKELNAKKENESSSSCRKVGEMLRKMVLEEGICILEDEKKKKMGELKKKCGELEMEKVVWEVEREKLLMMLDNQAMVVEAYKDMLDKEECLMMLFRQNLLSFQP